MIETLLAILIIAAIILVILVGAAVLLALWIWRTLVHRIADATVFEVRKNKES